MSEQDQSTKEKENSQANLPSQKNESKVFDAKWVKKPRMLLLVAGVIIVVAGIGIYLSWDGLCRVWMGKTPGVSTAVVKGDVYYCPMHPDYKSSKPDNCPICSMKLVKLDKPNGGGDTKQGVSGMAIESGDEIPGPPSGNTIFIDPQRRQLIGVRSVPVAMQTLIKEIRAVGKVGYDETKVTHIHTKITGYIDEVFVDYVGKIVKKGDPLFTIYSPDLVATQEEYLLALRARQQFTNSTFAGAKLRANSLLEAARSRLELWDITPMQIRAIEKEGKTRRALTIYSPVSGIVTERQAYHHGRYVSPEVDLYTIVDLSTVWINSDVYEYELPFVKTGLTAEIEFPYSNGTRVLRGKIIYVNPYLEAKTRTAKIRFGFKNSNYALKPEMFVNVRLKIDLGNKLVVPEDAVLDTGTEQYVFVDKGGGYFEPRAVKPGLEAGGYYSIESGLEPGELVVTSANFILDSESRLKGAFANMGKPGEVTKGGGSQSTLNIVVMEPKAAKVGSNPVRLTVKNPQGMPVTDAEVVVTLFMPQMGSMAPMESKATLKSMGNGEYTGTIDIPMAWSWQTTVTVKKLGKSIGSMQTTITAR